MKKSFAGLAAVAVSAASLSAPVAQAQSPGAAPKTNVSAERSLVGVRLGSQFMDVFRRFGAPNEVQTVALGQGSENLPGMGMGMGMGMGAAGDSGAMGGPGMMGPGMMGPGMMGNGMGSGMGAPGVGGPSMGGMMGPTGMSMGMGMGGPGGKMSQLGGPGGMGAGGFGGGSPFGGGGNGVGGGMASGLSLGDVGGSAGFGGPGDPSGFGAAGANTPEYSAATLFIYKRNNNKIRYEFLLNEDGRVAQISVTAQAGITVPGATTSRGIQLTSSYPRVLGAYGYPEKTRNVPGFRFMEAYYTKKNRAAFTFDTKKNMQCVRITIALAD